MVRLSTIVRCFAAGVLFFTSFAGRAGAQNLFSGVWSPGTDGHALWVTSDWGNFTSQWGAYESQGLRMDDFEVYLEIKQEQAAANEGAREAVDEALREMGQS